MGRKRNTFSKAIKHLKSTRIDEKLQVLNEIPTNSTSGLYSLVPGALTRVEIDRKNPTVPDYDTIDWDVDGSDGKDTSGLFDSSGESRFIAPPGDNSYIQGPMSAMYYTWAYPWTTIGYIRESDRRMVNLGRIDGKLGDWDGSVGNSNSGSGTFYSYGQLTTEQALWFRDTQKKDNAGNDPDNANYRAFYPGPPSNTADAFGRYLCTITGTPKGTKDNAKEVNPIDLNVDSNFSAIMDRLDRGDRLSKRERQRFRDTYGMDPEDARENKFLNDLGKKFNDAKDEVGNWMNQLKDMATSALDTLKLAKSGVEAIPTSADALFQYLNNNDPKHPDYRKNDPRSSNYTGPYEPEQSATWKNDVGNQIKNSLPPEVLERAKNSSDGKVELTQQEITQLSNNMKPWNKGDMRFHTFFNSLPVPNEHSTALPGENSPTRVTIDSEGNIDIVSNYRFSDRDDVSSGGPLMKMYVQSYMNKDKGDGEGVFPFYDRDQYADGERKQTGTTHDVNMRLRLNINGGNKSSRSERTKVKASDVKNFKTGVMRLMNSYSIDYKPEHLLSESRKTEILKNLKKPVVIPETKQKSYKVSPGKRLNQKTNFQGMDKLIGDTKLQKTFKKPQDIWSQDWQGYNAKLSQNKKNEVLELIGDGKHAFDYMLTDSKAKNAEEMEKFWGLHPELYSYNFNGKKYKATRKEQIKGDYIVFLVDETGKKSSMLQSTLNEKMAEEEEREMLDEYNKLNPKNEPIPYEKDPLFKKVAKRLKNEIDYPDKPARKGYPNEPPPKQVDGWHPEYGKRYKYDKLDPVSAVTMRNAPTGNPEIDANVEKAAKKPKI